MRKTEGRTPPGPDRRRGWPWRAEAAEKAARPGGHAARGRPHPGCTRCPRCWPPFPRSRAHGQETCHLPGACHSLASSESRPPQTSPASQLHGEASRAGRAWWTPLPVPVPKGRSSPWPLPGSQACWGSPLGSVCFLSLSPESEDGGLRGPHRPSHTCTRLGFRRPNSALPAPTSGSFPGTPA